MLVVATSAGLVSMTDVMAEQDESNAAFWLAERARTTARRLFQQPVEVRTEKFVQKKVVAARRPANPVYAAAGNQSICVRMCDGFYFPVGRMGGTQDIATHEAVCQSQCPGADTSLYVMRNSKIEDAVSARDGKAYARLRVAYRHTQTRDNTCSCKQAGSVLQASIPLSRDFTMRRGDSVMTENGVRVFNGKTQKGTKANNFVALSQSRDIDARKRQMLFALERVSAPRLTSARARAAENRRALQSQPAGSSPRFSAPANKSVRLVGPEQVMSQ